MTIEELRPQYDVAVANGIVSDLIVAADRHMVPRDLVLAVASRETNIKNELGDFGHGVGVMQVDRRYHSEAAHLLVHNLWMTTLGRQDLINAGVEILAKDFDDVRGRIDNIDDAWKIATAAYNCGSYNAMHGHYEGDCDAFTTGCNYSTDVFSRRPLFAALLRGE